MSSVPLMLMYSESSVSKVKVGSSAAGLLKSERGPCTSASCTSASLYPPWQPDLDGRSGEQQKLPSGGDGGLLQKSLLDDATGDGDLRLNKFY